MTSLSRVNGFFASAFVGGFSMLRLPRSISQTLVSVLGFAALANMGCATSIAAKYPHLDRRSVCLLVPDIEPDATEWIYDDNNVPISNFHPEVVDRMAATARTVFEYDPDANRDSVRYLPAPYNELTCPERFSMLPSQDPQTSPLPQASLDLSVHKRPSEAIRVPEPVAKQLAKCPNDNAARFGAVSYTVKFSVYVTDDGEAVSAYVKQSTLGDRETEACMVEVLRKTQWPAMVATVPEVTTAPVTSTAWRTFFAQAAPAEPVPNWLEESGIRRIQPQPAPPVNNPGGGYRPPRIFVIPLGPLAAAAAVFGTILLWSNDDAPAWVSELNPITGQPYTSRQEYDQVQRLSPQEIQQRQAAHIKATQSQPPPAPASTPSPQPQPQPAPQKQPDCPRNEIFVPERTDNVTGCFDKKGDIRCYSEKHYPCAGVHTHGILHYQEIRRGVCTEVAKRAVRCEGPFTISGPCGSVSTVECGDGGPQSSGIFVRK